MYPLHETRVDMPKIPTKIPEYAELKIGDQVIQLPIKQATIGQHVIDVTKLYAQTGYFTFDPGFMSTAACESKVTFIDGDIGILRHRGYNIKELAEKCNFLDVAYLLLHDNLPNKNEAKEFTTSITRHSMVNEQSRNLFGAFRHSAHPMAIMLAAVGSLAACYHDTLNIDSPEARELAAIRIVAKMPTLAAMAYKYSIGQPFIYPDNSMGFAENFLHMMFSTPCEKYNVSKTLSSALEKIFILHADHEQNASTSTVRIAGSSGYATTNFFAGG